MGKLTKETLLNRKIFNDIDTTKITKKQMKEINDILERYDTKTIKNRLVNIHDFIKYGVDDNWLGRIDIIRNELKNDVTSDYALEIRYGKDNVEEIKSTFKTKYGMTEGKFIDKFGIVDGPKKWEEYKIKSKTPWGLTACIDKFGTVDGPKKWEERLTKKVNTMSERKKIKPYRNGRTLIEYQERYGIKDGYKRWNKRNKKQSYRFSQKYYIDTYSEVDGVKMWDEYCINMDKTSLKSYIDRYGDELGKIKYETHIKRLSHIQTLDYYTEKYGEELGNIKYKELLLSKIINFDNGYSKVSQELFWGVYDVIKEDTDKIYFAELNDEYLIYVNQEWCRILKLDFKCGDKIIEFDGDYWHSKPEQIIKDKLRDEYLTSKGYKILRIKESEYYKNPLLVTEKCVKFIKG